MDAARPGPGLETKMNVLYRWHPRIEASLDGPVVDDALLHLQQSDLDGACGLHCVLMALMLFGVVDRDDLDDVTRLQRKRLRKLWRRSQGSYFAGSRARQLQQLLSPYARKIDSAIHKRGCMKKALPVLAKGGLCIVGISNKRLNHWVLAVGTGGRQKRSDYRPDQLLILDPSYPTLPMLPCNGLLSVRRKRRGRHVYTTAAGHEKVRIDVVLTLLGQKA